jgi:excisionase family DNA binding protein
MDKTTQELSSAERPTWERLLNRDSQCATVTIETTGKLLGLSRAAAYQAARNGEIPTIRFGRRLLVPKTALRRLLAVG